MISIGSETRQFVLGTGGTGSGGWDDRSINRTIGRINSDQVALDQAVLEVSLWWGPAECKTTRMYQGSGHIKWWALWRFFFCCNRQSGAGPALAQSIRSGDVHLVTGGRQKIVESSGELTNGNPLLLPLPLWK